MVKNDIISRQAAIDALTHFTNLSWDKLKTIYPMLTVLEELPSATRRGRWIIDKEFSNIGRCSFCGDRWGSVDQMNYCPSCGAKMGER